MHAAGALSSGGGAVSQAEDKAPGSDPNSTHVKKRKQLAALAESVDAASEQLRQLQLQNAALQQRAAILERYVNTRSWQVDMLTDDRALKAISDATAKQGVSVLGEPASRLEPGEGN